VARLFLDPASAVTKGSETDGLVNQCGGADAMVGGICQMQDLNASVARRCRKPRAGQPLVSVITACRNSEAYIEESITSVFQQSYENIEYIVIDGASTDRTIEIIRCFESRFDH